VALNQFGRRIDCNGGLARDFRIRLQHALSERAAPGRGVQAVSREGIPTTTGQVASERQAIRWETPHAGRPRQSETGSIYYGGGFVNAEGRPAAGRGGHRRWHFLTSICCGARDCQSYVPAAPSATKTTSAAQVANADESLPEVRCGHAGQKRGPGRISAICQGRASARAMKKAPARSTGPS
jgi:hypothetical protein